MGMGVMTRSVSMVSAGRRDDEPLDPPAWEIPGLIPAERLVSRSDDVVVTVGPVRVHSTGVLVSFHVRFRPGRERGADAFHDELLRMLKGSRSAGADRLVLELRYEDGSFLSNVDRSAVAEGSQPDAYLDLLDGGSHGPVWRFTFWVWPVPAGDVTVSAAWPECGVPQGETVLTGVELRAASDAVEPLD
jgi:hypothetical protein